MIKCALDMTHNISDHQYDEYIIVQQELADNINLSNQLEKLQIPVICQDLKVFNFVPTDHINYVLNNQQYEIKKEKNILRLINKAKMSLENFTDKQITSLGYYVEYGIEALENVQISKILNQRKLDLNMYYNQSLEVPIIIHREHVPLVLSEQILNDYYELNNSLTKSKIQIKRLIKKHGDLERLLNLYQYIIAVDIHFLNYDNQMLRFYNYSDVMYDKIKNFTLQYENTLQFAVIINKELLHHINPNKQPAVHIFYNQQYFKLFPYKVEIDVIEQFENYLRLCRKNLVIPDKILSNDQLIPNKALKQTIDIWYVLKILFFSRISFLCLSIIMIAILMILLFPKYQQLKEKLTTIIKKRQRSKQQLQESQLFGIMQSTQIPGSQIQEKTSVSLSQYQQQKLKSRINTLKQIPDQSSLPTTLRSKINSNGSFIVNPEVNCSQHSGISSICFSDPRNSEQHRDQNHDVLNSSILSNKRTNVIHKRSFSYFNLNNISTASQNDNLGKNIPLSDNLPPIVQKSSTFTDLLQSDNSSIKFKKNMPNLSLINQTETDSVTDSKDKYDQSDRHAKGNSEAQKSDLKAAAYGIRIPENEADIINFGDSMDSDSCQIQNPFTAGRSKTLGLGQALHIISEENLLHSDLSSDKPKKEPGKDFVTEWQTKQQKHETIAHRVATQPVVSLVHCLVKNANARSEISLVKSDKNTDSQDDYQTPMNLNESDVVRVSIDQIVVCSGKNNKQNYNYINIDINEKNNQQQQEDQEQNSQQLIRSHTKNQSGLAVAENSSMHVETPHMDGISIPDFVIQKIEPQADSFQELIDIEADVHIGSTSNNSETFKMSLHDDEQ